MLLFFLEMEKRPGPAELLLSLLRNNNYSLHELDHLFRLLSKRSHPDATGGSGDEFIALRRIYEQARLNLARSATESGLQRTGQTARPFAQEAAVPGGLGSTPSAGARTADTRFDPYTVVLEAGFDRSLSARGCLFLSLRSFFDRGLHNYRIRSMKGFKKRNSDLMRSILYWSRNYDPEFGRIFSSYSRHGLQSLSTTWEIKNFNYAKRLFLDGVHSFFAYQRTGRTGTAEVAREKMAWCSYTLQKVIKHSHPMAPLSEWFIEELELPPELLDQSHSR